MTACPSSMHGMDGEPAPEARFSGTFRALWWEQGRIERVAYCLRCAGMGVVMQCFTPGEPSTEIEAWIETKGHLT